jgi:hypothetical protein
MIISAQWDPGNGYRSGKRERIPSNWAERILYSVLVGKGFIQILLRETEKRFLAKLIKSPSFSVIDSF